MNFDSWFEAVLKRHLSRSNELISLLAAHYQQFDSTNDLLKYLTIGHRNFVTFSIQITSNFLIKNPQNSTRFDLPTH
jgi:hypothetical protein